MVLLCILMKCGDKTLHYVDAKTATSVQDAFKKVKLGTVDITYITNIDMGKKARKVVNLSEIASITAELE